MKAYCLLCSCWQTRSSFKGFIASDLLSFQFCFCCCWLLLWRQAPGDWHLSFCMCGGGVFSSFQCLHDDSFYSVATVYMILSARSVIKLTWSLSVNKYKLCQCIQVFLQLYILLFYRHRFFLLKYLACKQFIKQNFFSWQIFCFQCLNFSVKIIILDYSSSKN